MSVGKKLIGLSLLAGIAGALLWAAAPALSTAPYVAGATDFEQPLGGVERLRAPDAARTGKSQRSVAQGTPPRFRSAVLTAPKRFDLAGLAGERRELELRARESGGEWSRWVAATNGDPVYFGGADELQLQTHGWRPDGRIHYVNVSGTTSAPETILTRFREAVHSAFVSAAGVVDPPADALPTRPTIISRAQWGAGDPDGGCKPRTAASRGRVKAAAVHHTVTASRYSEAEAPAIVLGICRYHRNANGWNDIGYNALVDRFGNLYAGRAGGIRKPIVGAHAQGFNAQTTGIAAIGTHTTSGIAAPELGSIVDFLAWKLSVHRIRARGKTTLVSAGGDASRYDSGTKVRAKRIIGHRDVGLTSCPGNGLYAQLPKIRRLTQQRIDDAEDPPPVEEPPPVEPPPEETGGVRPR